ncbi:inorganic diphosphatase [Eubacteriales bacterium OttesenSCG-928-G02]|nr:inorganic diphosphatase [Eubacteriales bacterium OttesenSCG-928-G02]
MKEKAYYESKEYRESPEYIERKSVVKSYLGKRVHIEIDRPIGYVHKKGEKTLTYNINYGYIPGVLGGDGEELDVYVLDIDHPVDECEVEIIGIVHREDGDEDKLISRSVPDSSDQKLYTLQEVEDILNFQEKYYKTTIELL